MENKFVKLMAAETDKGLQECLDNRAKFVPEAIEAAIAEMQKRGRIFSDEELSTFKQEFQVRKEAKEKEADELFGNWKKNVVVDENAPAYYSPRAIWGFSLFFTVIFGAVLLSSNLKDNKAKWIVLGFGIFYTIILIAIMNLLPQINSGLSIGLNAVGAYLLTNIFWDKYVGKETKFRTKPIWKPLIISILITIPFILAIIYG